MSHVVIIGGGFGGLAAARALDGSPVKITLVDRRNHHLFQPLLYQVATAALPPSDIAEPIRSILARQANVDVRLGSVTSIDRATRTVHVESDAGPTQLTYDHLVLATGVRHSYFGHDEWEDHAPGLKTVGDALDIRGRLLSAFERAEWTTDPDERRRLLTFVVVGGGPTGVELAGALAEIAMTTLRRDFRHIDTAEAHVLLVEASPSILNGFHEDLRAAALQQVSDLGVEVRLGVGVTAIDDHGVTLGDTVIPAATVLWAAGVEAGALARSLGTSDRSGRIDVGDDCSLPDHPDVFAVGDVARFVQDGAPIPGLAPAAMQMGTHVAACIRADLTHSPRPTFRYRHKGSMATIGTNKAIMEVGRLRWSGRLAWLAWVFIHLTELNSFRNRLSVFATWAWSWLFYGRASRIIWKPGEGRS